MYFSGIRCMLMRGGTSKGAYFLADDLPSDPQERDDLLLRIMGSPDPRQIDGIGGAHALTSKVAIVSRSDTADIDYLFVQLGVDEATVSVKQNCGNLLAGVGPFAVERGLITPGRVHTETRIRMVNSDSVATARFPTPDGYVDYQGDTAIAGVPGTAAEVALNFEGTAGSFTGSLLPTGNIRDVIDGVEVTCVDNGMPVVVAAAKDLGISGYESYQDLAADEGLRERIQSLRLKAGKLMVLSGSSVPKTTLVAPARDGGTICMRTFIPVKPHTSIGVLGAISAMTAALLEGGVAQPFATPRGHSHDIEHPTGHLVIELDIDTTTDPPTIRRAGNIRTARKLFDGFVFPRPTGESRVTAA
ncbi:4-oxalomesaconate tautomerase [Kibdelosporangium aridum]|uniref:4-oxalomesaconate tautomerase n=1 Tax=Kibdelosporangium aridum TaxID=2030 RepID=UPI0005251D86